MTITTTLTAPPGPGPELAAVLRVLDEAPGQLPPPVVAAAAVLAAELITYEVESCPVCAGLPDPCDRCWALSRQAATFRMLADRRKVA